MSNRPYTINSRKFDGSIRRSWTCEHIATSGSLLTFVGQFDIEVRHEQLGVIRPGTVSYEFYWLDRWYNVFRFHEPEGGLRNFYCNLNMPPLLSDGTLDYIDLDIDVLVLPDSSTTVLDRDDFTTNAEIYNYPEEVKVKVERSLEELLKLIESRLFPFDDLA